MHYSSHILQLLFFIIGLCFGSFGSVLVTRIPSGRSICGRSGCPQCQKKLSPLELIPICSFLILRGRCKNCTVKISWIYPGIELLSGIAFVAAYHMHQDITVAVLLGLIVWLLLLISIIDISTHTISDLLNLPLLLLTIAYSNLLGQFEMGGMILGVAFFGAQWLLSRGKCLGSGDIILAASIGALMGSWERMAACLFLIYIIGAAIASTMLLTGCVKRGQYVAFAPFMVIGAVVSLVLQTRIDLFLGLYFGL